ncbi:MAG: Gx transporter family protein [Oscillospiraceae bacterium]|nr:Gx transporter family protein [Oscillospiraceae bacterium]
MNKTRRIVSDAAFLAISLIISYIEAIFSLSAIIPIPGIKLGFANIITLYLISRKRFADALAVAVLRCTITFIIFGNPVSFFLSLSGAVLAVFFMSVSLILIKRGFSEATISICGSAGFTVGQTVSAAICFSSGVFYYFPVMFAAAGITGLVTGIISVLTFKRIDMITGVTIVKNSNHY